MSRDPHAMLLRARAALEADPNCETHRAWLDARKRAGIGCYRPGVATVANVLSFRQPGSLRIWKRD
jgi:hypothetical protein